MKEVINTIILVAVSIVTMTAIISCTLPDMPSKAMKVEVSKVIMKGLY